MDPLSITASVAGVSTVIAETIVIVDSVVKYSKSASSKFVVLRDEVQSMASVVDDLQSYVDNGAEDYNAATFARMITTTQMKQELDICKATLIPVQVELGIIEKKLTGNPYVKNMHRLIWHWKRAKLAEFRNNVQGSKCSILLINLMWAL